MRREKEEEEILKRACARLGAPTPCVWYSASGQTSFLLFFLSHKSLVAAVFLDPREREKEKEREEERERGRERSNKGRKKQKRSRKVREDMRGEKVLDEKETRGRETGRKTTVAAPAETKRENLHSKQTSLRHSFSQRFRTFIPHGSCVTVDRGWR